MPRPSVCIKVPKTNGEKTLTLVTKFGLADKSLVIQREEESLCIPLVREPQGIELTTLKNQIPKFSLLTAVFSEKQLLPETLPQALQYKLPAEFTCQRAPGLRHNRRHSCNRHPTQTQTLPEHNRRSNPANTKKRYNCPSQSKRRKRHLSSPRLRLHRWGTQNSNHSPRIRLPIPR